MEIETVTIEHVPDSHKVHLALFRDVDNADFLHQQLLARNSDFEYAFIDGSIIVSRKQLLSAVFKAVTGLVNNALKTPNVHSEIVASLNPSSNIADAYRRFGVSPTTKDLIVVKVTFPTDTRPQPPTAQDIAQHLEVNVKGTPLSVSDENITNVTDMTKVRKYYKLNGLNWLDALDDATKRKESEALVLGAMALRGV